MTALHPKRELKGCVCRLGQGDKGAKKLHPKRELKVVPKRLYLLALSFVKHSQRGRNFLIFNIIKAADIIKEVIRG